MPTLLAHSPSAHSATDPRFAYALPSRAPGTSDHRRQSAALVTRHENAPAGVHVADFPFADRTLAEHRSEVLKQLAAGRRIRATRELR